MERIFDVWPVSFSEDFREGTILELDDENNLILRFYKENNCASYNLGNAYDYFYDEANMLRTEKEITDIIIDTVNSNQNFCYHIDEIFVDIMVKVFYEDASPWKLMNEFC